MAKPKPKAEEMFTYTAEAPIGVDAGALLPGTKVKVREIVDAGEKGAHNDKDDAVVIEWEAPALVHGDNGVTLGTSPRAMSISLASFHDLFEKGE